VFDHTKTIWMCIFHQIMVEVSFKVHFLHPQMLMNAIKQDLALQILFARTWKAATAVNVTKDIKRILQRETSAKVCKVQHQ